MTKQYLWSVKKTGHAISGCALLRQRFLRREHSCWIAVLQWLDKTHHSCLHRSKPSPECSECPKEKWMLLCSGPKSCSQLWAAKSSLAALDSGCASSTEADVFLRDALHKDTGINISPWVALGKPPGRRSSTLLLPLQQRNFPACPESPVVPTQGEAHVREPCEDDWAVCPDIPLLHPITSRTSQLQRKATAMLPITAQPARSLTVRTESLHQSHQCTIRSSSWERLRLEYQDKILLSKNEADFPWMLHRCE